MAGPQETRFTTDVGEAPSSKDGGAESKKSSAGKTPARQRANNPFKQVAPQIPPHTAERADSPNRLVLSPRGAPGGPGPAAGAAAPPGFMDAAEQPQAPPVPQQPPRQRTHHEDEHRSRHWSPPTRAQSVGVKQVSTGHLVARGVLHGRDLVKRMESALRQC